MLLEFVASLLRDLDGVVLWHQRIHKVNTDHRQMGIGEAEGVPACCERFDECGGLDANDAQSAFDFVEGGEAGALDMQRQRLFIESDPDVSQNALGIGVTFILRNMSSAIYVDDGQHLVGDGDARSEINGNVDYHINVQVLQAVRLERNPHICIAQAATWWAGCQGMRGALGGVLKDVERDVEYFAKLYKEANPQRK